MFNISIAQISTQSNQMLVLEERGKPEYPEKNLSEQSRQPTNSAHISLVGGECSTTSPSLLPWHWRILL